VKYDLKSMVKRKTNVRRKSITFRQIVPPASLASDLYAVYYGPIIKHWASAEAALVSQYDRSLSELTSDSPSQIGYALSAIESEANTLILTLRIRLEAWAARIEKWQRGRWAGAVKTATRIDISAMLGPQDMRMPVSSVIERNVGLIKSVSDQARQRIGEAVFGGLNKRAPAREVAADIRTAVAMGRRRSMLIASDQLTKLNSELARERAMEAGLSHYEWVHSGKLHPREAHKARNGQRYEYGQPAGDEPGYAINCGCNARAVLDLDSEF
jgi:uncharacterized protein with gpF-like domain